MMKPKPLTLAFAVAAGALVAQPAQAQDMPEPQTITAQVVDMACYLNAGLKGTDHKMCAEVCAKAGVPLVFLGEDGNIYLPTGKGMPSAGQTETLMAHAEQQVTVTGVVMERSGARSIIIDKIEAAGP
jgi:hypothetical protein